MASNRKKGHSQLLNSIRISLHYTIEGRMFSTYKWNAKSKIFKLIHFLDNIIIVMQFLFDLNINTPFLHNKKVSSLSI